MNKKQLYMIAVLMFGFIAVPAAQADVVLQYIVVDDGHSYRGPAGYRSGSRLYNNYSRFQNYTYSSRARYRDRCDDRRYYSPPRQYRNNYYYGNQGRYQRPEPRRQIRSRVSKNHRYDEQRRSYSYQDKKYRHSEKGNRVHINVN